MRSNPTPALAATLPVYLLGAAAGVGWWWWKGRAEPAVEFVAGRRTDSLVATAERRDLEYNIEVSGDIEPLVSVDVKPEVTARIEEIIEGKKIPDWVDKLDVHKDMRNDIDDLLYDTKGDHAVAISPVEIAKCDVLYGAREIYMRYTLKAVNPSPYPNCSQDTST